MSDPKTPINNESSAASADQKAESHNAEKKTTNDATVASVASSNKKEKIEPVNSKKANIQKAVASKKAEKSSNLPSKVPSSKLTLLALFIAASAIATSAVHYSWQQEQNSALSQALNKQRQQEITASQVTIQKSLSAKFSQQLKQQLAQQQESFNQQLKQVAQQAHQESEGGVKQLSKQVSLLEQHITQRQPSDWLIHEAEYLIRVAARTMWLERDTKAAIGLLKEADSRLNELEQPKFLPIRALINQDIAALALMPTLENQQAILSLMALNTQTSQLPLAGVNLSAAVDSSMQESVELSSDINDWQSNLKKTWQKFLNDFITVRRRTGMVEPLMAPEQQQHLKQNLSLKIQLAQWAASEYKTDIYQQTLVDIQTWMNEFFDMEADINQKFYQAIAQAKQHTIHYDYPSTLTSLTAIMHLNDEAIVPQKIVIPESQEKTKNEPVQTKIESDQEIDGVIR